jgi:RHS repeat-associated protein
MNQLEQVEKNSQVVASYIYDPSGFRVQKVGSKGKIDYVPLLNGEVGYRKEFSTSKEYSYIYVGGTHLARVNGVIGSDGKKFYYQNDHEGSALVVTDGNGNKVVDRDFAPFGEKIKTNDREEPYSDETEDGFTGKDWDEDVGLYYYNARWYDAEIGRFISEDSISDPNNPNEYAYCADNPLNMTDLTGHKGAGINLVGGTLGLAAYIPGVGNILAGSSAFTSFVGDMAKKSPAGSFWEKLNNKLKGLGFVTNEELKKKAEENKSTTSGVSNAKVDAALDKLPKDASGNLDYTKINHDTIMKVADGLSDSERLYLCALVAYGNPKYDKGFMGVDKPKKDSTTWCNAYAADVLYLFNGSTDLMSSSVDPKHPEKYGNFEDPTKGDWTITTTSNDPKVEDQKKVLNDTNKFSKVADAKTAQDLANQGKFVVGFTDGHIAIVMPGEGLLIRETGVFFPSVAQQGRNKFIDGVRTTITRRDGSLHESSSWVMNWSWGATDYSNVQFYQFMK